MSEHPEGTEPTGPAPETPTPAEPTADLTPGPDPAGAPLPGEPAMADPYAAPPIASPVPPAIPAAPPQPDPYAAPVPSDPYAGPGGYPTPGSYPTQPYGAQPQPYGAQPQPYGAQPYGAPPQPYAAPAPGAYGYPMPGQAAYGPPPPGSLAFVEQHFGKVASFGQRVLALLIDSAVALIGVIPMILGVIIVVASAPDTETDVYGMTHSVAGTGSGAGLALGVVLIVAGWLTSLAIAIWNRIFRMGRTGQSIGKRAMGLMLVNATTGRPIGAGQTFLRELVQQLINSVFYLGYLWMLWDTDKQTLGDKTVGSTVIELARR